MATGKLTAASIEPSDTYFEKATTATKIRKQTKETSGTKATITPSIVATPLPPLKPT